MVRASFVVLILLLSFWAGTVASAEEAQVVQDAGMEAESVRTAWKKMRGDNSGSMSRFHQQLKPLKVGIRSGAGVPGYESRFREIFIEALNEWCKASCGKVRVQVVDSAEDADIKCFWIADLRMGEQRIGAECHWFFDREGICLAVVKLGVPWRTGPHLSDAMFKRVSLQAIGLALGLDYSDCAEDVMSDEFARHGREPVLSDHDKKAIRQLYAE